MPPKSLGTRPSRGSKGKGRGKKSTAEEPVDETVVDNVDDSVEAKAKQMKVVFDFTLEDENTMVDHHGCFVNIKCTYLISALTFFTLSILQL